MYLYSWIKTHRYIPLLSICLFGALWIRLWKLDQLPANLHEDEVLVGYVGRYIWQHGKDIYGNSWPFWYFDKFGDYYIIGPFYLSGLSTLIFGMNAWAIRFPTAFLGALTVLPLGYVAYVISNDRRVALIVAYLCAFLPWHVVLSRSSSEGVLGSFFFISGLALSLYGIHHKKTFIWWVGQCFWLLTYWIYHPFRVYVPAFSLTCIFFYHALRTAHLRLRWMIVTIGFVALTGYIYLQPWGSGRLAQTSVFAPLSGVEIRQTSLTHEISDAPRMTRFMHNKIFMYGREIASQYFTYLSPPYLFIRGWGDKFVVPEQGMLFITSGIGLIFAIWYLRTDLYKTCWLLMIMWTAIALVPPALTYAESPNMNRAALYPLLLICLSAYGLSRIPWRVMCISVCVLFLWEIWYFGYMYQTHFDQANALRRQDAATQISAKIDSYAQNDTKVWVPGTKTLAVYYLFTHRDLSPVYMKQFKKGARLDMIGKVHFANVACPTIEDGSEMKKYSVGDIVVLEGACPQEGIPYLKHLETVRGVSELLGYRVYTVVRDPLAPIQVQ